MVALTIGMATYDDFDGVYFTLQSLRFYQDLDDTELLVIDNFGCEFTQRFVESLPDARYVKASDLVGTAAPRDLVFRRALGKAVVCMDSHVMLAPGVVARLKAYYRDHPDTIDLLQGPLVYDDMRAISTHFAPEWSSQMWGVWETDPRGNDPDGEPFDIPMQGLGVFSCRRRAWPGFNPAFRGFGGEEGYIHEKVRQHGGRTLCLPWLRWVHRFSRPKGVPYPLAVEDKFRNYIIGHTELGLDIAPAVEHFSQFLPAATIDAVIAAARAEPHDVKAKSSSSPAKTRDRKRKKDRKPAEPVFDDDMIRALLDAIPDEVRIAYGLDPVGIADFPPVGPDRDAARLESREMLLSQGWLEAAHLDLLTVDEAIALAQMNAREGLGALTATGERAAEPARRVRPSFANAPHSPPRRAPDGLPMVSCICPTYNRAPSRQYLLEEAIESFLRQTYPNKELIVFNDCPGQLLVCNAPGVRVINVPRRYPSLGDKYNAAIAAARGDLIAPWEDDDVSLPWRLSLSVERLGDAGYFNPKRYWLMLDTEIQGDQSTGYGHNLSLFSREAFERVGGYPPVSGAQDATMDNALLGSVECRGVPSTDQSELPMAEWYYIYRWCVSPTHLSGSESPEEFYRFVGTQPIEPGRFVLQPHWREDYEARIAAHLLAPAG